MGEVYIGDKIHQRPIGRKVKVEVTKNKSGPHGGSGFYNFYYSGKEVGIDHVDELVTLSKEYGVVRSAGPWISFGEQQWQGQAKFVAALKEDRELYSRVEKELDFIMTGEIVE